VLAVRVSAPTRRILDEMLRAWHMQPTTVASGSEALEAMRQAASNGEPFHLVLVDAMMPEMDGFMLIEQINNCPELDGAAIMMLTSADHLEDINRCRLLGLNRYLIKPIKQSELLDAILQSLGSLVVEPEPTATNPQQSSTSNRSL